MEHPIRAAGPHTKKEWRPGGGVAGPRSRGGLALYLRDWGVNARKRAQKGHKKDTKGT